MDGSGAVRLQKPFSAYTGDDPYIFVCYAHADDQIIFPEIASLRQQGINVWYDEGISAGRNWRAEVGEAIKGASKVLFYVSSHSLSSDHCSREINFSLDQPIAIIPVYLEDVSLPTDLQVGLSRVQALHRNEDSRYKEHLLAALLEDASAQATCNTDSRASKRKKLSYPGVLGGVGLLFAATLVYFSNTQTFVNEPVHTLIIEPFATDSAASAGLEYEVKRLLDASPKLLVRVASGQSESADYHLEGKIENGVLISQLSEYRGGAVTKWRIDLPGDFSSAAGTLARDLLVSLGQDVTVLSRFNEEIPAQTYRNYLLASALLRHSHTPEAISSAVSGFSQVIEHTPNYAPAHAGLCSAYLEHYLYSREDSYFQLAEVHCHRALTLGGRSPSVYIGLGMLYRETGQLQKSTDSYKKALEMAPYSTDAMRGMAETLVRTGGNAEAQNLYLKAIDVEPNHWENYQALGAYQFSNGAFEQALESFEIAFALAPNEWGIMSNIGSAHFMAGNYKKATVYWEQAAALQPSAPIYANLGASYFYQRDFAAAARMYTRAHQEVPGDHRYLGDIGAAYYVSALGEHSDYFRQAIELALNQLRIDPNDLPTIASLASYYAGLGEAENANSFIKRALSPEPEDADVLYSVAVAYTRMSQKELAQGILKRLISLGYESKLIELDANFDVLYQLPLPGDNKKTEEN